MNDAILPVLIVGAGPVGLTMACEVLRRGISCRIIDRAPAPTPLRESRALAIWERTLEVFDDMGVVVPHMLLYHDVKCVDASGMSESQNAAQGNGLSPVVSRSQPDLHALTPRDRAPPTAASRERRGPSPASPGPLAAAVRAAAPRCGRADFCRVPTPAFCSAIGASPC